MTERTTGRVTRPAPPPRLVLEQQLSVFRQWPQVVGDDRLELVDDVAQGGLRRDDGRGERAGFVMDRSRFVRVVLRITQRVDRVDARVSESGHLDADRVDALRRWCAGELTEIPRDGGQDHRRGDVDGRARLDVDDLDVALPVDLDARGELALGQDAEARE